MQHGGGAARTAEYRIPIAKYHLLRPPALDTGGVRAEDFGVTASPG
jgi:hypothetical protein